MTNTLLKNHFPLIHTREEILTTIRKNKRLLSQYRTWNQEQQEYFLDICTGAKGVKMLYDSFFKTVFNPDVFPDRLETLLSLLLKQKVTIVRVLPNDDTRLTDESSLLILDILVELEDGSFANIECQKIGYDFPGERCACYSADLLLRQYIRIKGEKDKRRETFKYRDIKSVYTIVFMEKSSAAFHRFPNDYIHHFQQISNTGLKLNMLQEFFLIPIDIFTGIHQNKDVSKYSDLEAWLIFLSTDQPDLIVELITYFPQFKPMYEDVYDLCLNIERVMNMYSKELLELDRNTVHFMMDQMKEQIEKDKSIIADKDAEIADKEAKIADKEAKIAELERQLAALKR